MNDCDGCERLRERLSAKDELIKMLKLQLAGEKSSRENWYKLYVKCAFGENRQLTNAVSSISIPSPAIKGGV